VIAQHSGFKAGDVKEFREKRVGGRRISPKFDALKKIDEKIFDDAAWSRGGALWD
jgi:hypothetical protein